MYMCIRDIDIAPTGSSHVYVY